MKGRMKPAICCTVSALTLTMAVSMVTMAKETTSVVPSSSSTNLQETDWTYRAVADVTDELFIRSNASDSSKIIGYLPSAGGAYVLEKGNEWTKIRSGNVVGYTKTKYLAFGTDAKKLAQVYGTPGVEAAWDGVNIFNNADPAAKVVDTVHRGTGYESTSQDGHWVSIVLDDSTSAYVPAEDVKETLLLETAVATDDYVPPAPTADSSFEDETSWNESYNDGNSDGDTENTDTSPETEGSWTQTPETQVPETEAPQTETPWTEAPETETAWTEVPETETSWTDTPETETPWTETPETEAPQTEAVSTETPATEPSNSGSSASSDDLTLLASIIYCEAGNQPRDGKVAVGAVVLNRVASSSFAGTIKDVIYESGQFMPTWDGSMSSALAGGVPSDCYEAAQAALNGENPVGGAMFFNTGSGKGIKIGAHQFY